jgi:hypothetical protein
MLVSAIQGNSRGSAGGARARGRPGSWGAAVALAIGLGLSAAPARADDDDGSARPWNIDVHAFVSQGFILSSDNNYLARSRRGSFEFTEVGLNLTKSISDDLSVGMQLFMRDLGPIGNYKPQFDWFYLDYHFRDWLGLRAGRTKVPFGLYNEQSDIDSARVPVLLPQSIYSTTSRDFLLAQTGFEAYGYVPLAAAGALDYRLYGGTIFIDQTSFMTVGATVAGLDVPYLAGTRVLWRTPLDGLSVGGTAQLLRLDIDFKLDPGYLDQLKQQGAVSANASDRFKYRLPAFLWVASLEYAAHDVQLAAEYSRQRYDYKTRPQLVPDGNLTSTRWYVMGSFHATPWFSPGAYYSVWNNGVAGPDTRDKYQQDVAVTTRYDLTQNWLLKLEGHYMRGTAGLNSALNSNFQLSTLKREWGVFMVKTTAYF